MRGSVAGEEQMTRHSRGEWSLVAAACWVAVASACGSRASKSDSNDSDAAPTCFHNVPIAGSHSSDCASSSSSNGEPASSGSTPGVSARTPASHGPLDSGTADSGKAVENDNDGGREPKSWGGRSFDGGSDDPWVNAVVMIVQMAGRAGCDPLTRDPKLDVAAEQLASDSSAMPNVGAAYHWNGATADELDTALGILRPPIVDNAPACKWHRYGIGVVGDPGGTRRIVFMLAE